MLTRLKLFFAALLIAALPACAPLAGSYSRLEDRTAELAAQVERGEITQEEAEASLRETARAELEASGADATEFAVDGLLSLLVVLLGGTGAAGAAYRYRKPIATVVGGLLSDIFRRGSKPEVVASPTPAAPEEPPLS